MASRAIDLIQIISELMNLLPPAIYCPQPPLHLLNIYSISLVPVLLLDRSHARWQNVPSKGFQPSASAATLVSFLLDRSRSSACSLPTLSLAFSRMCASYVLGTGWGWWRHGHNTRPSPIGPRPVSPGNASLTSRLPVSNPFPSSSPPSLLPPPPPHQDDIFTAALKSSSPKKTTLQRHTNRPSLSFVHSHGKNSKN